MIAQLVPIFLNVIAPVFGLVLVGAVLGRRLGLEARTLSRFAYFILVPAFVFDVMRTASLDAGEAVRMMAFFLLLQLAGVVLAALTARALGRPPEMVAAFVLLAGFPNVGNFGFPIIAFHLGTEALVPATVYFLLVVFSGFVIGVTAATWTRGGGLRALGAVLKTPALLAVPPALLVNFSGLDTPLAVSRMTGLLGAAMVPTMLVTLGVQIAAVKRLRLSVDMVAASAVRLLGGTALAFALVVPFGLTALNRDTGVIQAAMPCAVLTSLIALEHDLLPEFVTSTVLFSTLASVVTVTLVLVLL